MISLFCFSFLSGRAYPSGSGEKDFPDRGTRFSLEEQKADGTRRSYFFWKDGIQVEGPGKKISFHIGGSTKADTGRLNADDQLSQAFPGFAGQASILRSLRVNSLLTLYGTVEWILEVDFANPTQFKENWFGLVLKIPYVGQVRAGYMKEPFGLEILTSSTNLTFMETGLPISIFAPGSNLGIRLQNTARDERVTWSLGGFWNAQPTDKLDDARDRIENSNGFDLTMRFSGIPWYEENGRRLFHFALG
jgi:phosphate-selective porin